MDTGGGEEGEDEMYGESNMETYNKIDSQWELLYDSRNSNRAPLQPRGVEMGRETRGRFGREGTWVYLWLILVHV